MQRRVSTPIVKVELGEGVFGVCRLGSESGDREEKISTESRSDLSSLSSMLEAKWKRGQGAAAKREPVRAGQIRSFRISKLDAAAKRIELDLA